jgi:hypothetical protein
MYPWEEPYSTAVLEADRSKLAKRIKAARSAISQRVQELNADHHGSPEERRAIDNALAALDLLSTEVSHALPKPTRMFTVGDRVAVIHSHRGKDKRRKVVRIDTVWTVTSKYIVTEHAQFHAETGFQVCSDPEYQITALAPEHETELERAAKRRTRSRSQKP